MDIIIFQCRDLGTLFVSEQYFPSFPSRPSSWGFISYIVSFFSECECVFIETKYGDLPFSCLKSATLLVYMQDAFRSLPKLRYLILGSRENGYLGIEGIQECAGQNRSSTV